MEKKDLIEEFLDKKLLTAKSTRRCYRVNIEKYFRLLDKDINTYLKNGNTLEDYESDLRRVYLMLQEQRKGLLSIRTVFTGVKQFMVTHDKELKDLDFWELLKNRTKGAEPASDSAIFNTGSIKEILSHGNACSRAMFLMLASSGRRIGEILALLPSDVNTDVSPATINIKKTVNGNTTKTGQKTLCFISDEALSAYKTWMKERDEYLRISLKRGNHEKDANDPRVFPMSYHNALIIWRNLLMKANLVEIENFKDKYTGKMNRRIKREHKGERTLSHPHCLRRFYRSYLGDADLAEYLMGHGTILTKTYRRMRPEDLAEKYRKLMQNVTIFENTSKDVEELRKSDKEKDERIKELETKLANIENLLGLKKQMEELIKNGK